MQLNWRSGLPLGVVGLGAFGLGQLASALEPPDITPQCVTPAYQETTIVQLNELVGDQLKLSLNGPARVVWNNDYLEGDGEHTIALGQLPSEQDRDFRQFAYVGNAKTFKFYPSDSYPARGTHPTQRRFFASRSAAEAAGFVASKLVK